MFERGPLNGFSDSSFSVASVYEAPFTDKTKDAMLQGEVLPKVESTKSLLTVNGDQGINHIFLVRPALCSPEKHA